jgi:ribosomal protein S18 acetylase RimI-like enzyme
MTDADTEPIVIEGPAMGRAAECEPILRALPRWFGIEAAILQYVQDIAQLPTFVARRGAQVVGFISLKRHSDYAAEIYVLGVYLEHQRQGIGRRLVAHAEVYLQQQAIEFVQVKTLGPSRPSRAYEQTRAFYLAMGYRPLEELTTIWGAENPCLIMIKHLQTLY